MSDTIRVGLVQGACTEDSQNNLRNAVARIEEAKQEGASIVCLQELFNTTYFCQKEEAERFDLAEPIPGPTVEAIQEVAKKNEIVVIAPLFERRAAGVYHNTACVIDADGSLLGTYRKNHIPDDPGFYEKFYFTPGDLGYPVFKTRAGTIGVLICWDQWYPEAARLMALKGAEILFYPTAIGWSDADRETEGEVQRDSWKTIQRAHGIANGLFIASVNRVGREEGLTFWGSSFVSDPQGKEIASAGEEEELLIADLDRSRIEEVRRNWPFLRDRRIDTYQDLDSRWIGP